MRPLHVAEVNHARDRRLAKRPGAVAYMPRYRQPVDWVFYLLAGAAVSEIVERRRAMA